MNPMVTTNQKSATDTQKLGTKEHQKTTKENHQITREETKEEKYSDELQKQPENKYQNGK